MTDTSSAPPPGGSDLPRARELYVALTLLDEDQPPSGAVVSFNDIMAFLCGDLTLSEQQQEMLFTEQRVSANFHAIVNDLTVKRRSRETLPPDQVTKAETANIVHLPLRAAASDGSPLSDWIFPGGSMKIRDFGPNEKLLTISLDDIWEEQPTALLLESPYLRRVALIDLKDPEPSFSSDLNFIRNLDDPKHVLQIEILENPTFTGVLLSFRTDSAQQQMRD
jgi:hypothetical protein